MTQAIEIIVMVLLVLAMVVNGFIRRPGRKFSWPMFIRHASVVVDMDGVRDGKRQDINIYALFPAGEEFMMSTGELQEVIDYLGTQYEDIQGNGIVRYSGGVLEVRIRNGVLAVGSD
ncbi:hypothetical protein ABZY34_05160 [Streptomyces virginiae]|uniref:hypothetical protein n=1 Tax=Streptomyces virginiae TaxID=1961 RepID=UPI0033BF0200